MAYPHNVDVDALTYYVLNYLGGAIDAWIAGRPHDEPALLNHITGALARRHRGCDVGLRSRVRVEAQVVDLHRRGENSTDRFGADLVVTLYAPGRRFAKTAFFQLKKSDQCDLTLQRHQLEDAQVDHRIAERSFVLAVDEVTQKMRIASVSTLLGEFPSNADTHSVSSFDWSAITTWLARWLACEEAPSSDLRSPGNVEGLLESFARDESVAGQVWTIERNRIYAAEYPDGYSPARVWTPIALRDEEFTDEIFPPPKKP